MLLELLSNCYDMRISNYVMSEKETVLGAIYLVTVCNRYVTFILIAFTLEPLRITLCCQGHSAAVLVDPLERFSVTYCNLILLNIIDGSSGYRLYLVRVGYLEATIKLFIECGTFKFLYIFQLKIYNKNTLQSEEL